MKRLFALFAFIFCVLQLALAEQFTLTILHTNDLHGRVEPVKIKEKSYGGYARHVTLIERLRRENPNVLLLNGGDTFQGTLYFNVYEGLADAALMNLMGYHAACLGNHEFDRGPAPLAAFAKSVSFPLLACNLDLSAEPSLKDQIKDYVIVEVNGHKIGLVGAVTDELMLTSSPGPTIKTKDLLVSIQSAVDALHAKGIHKIILLSHLGLPEEKRVATKVRGLDVIVGGHTHSLLGELNHPDLPKAEGDYPIVEKGPDGHQVLIVSAWEWGKVLGRIQVQFNKEGRVTGWHNARPIIVDDSIPQHPIARSMIAAFQAPILKARQEILASTETGLDGSRERVRNSETTMGNLITDAMLAKFEKAGAQIALMNGGGIRASIEPGPISLESAIQVQPFGNTLVLIDLSGEQIKKTLEHGASGIEEGKGAFLHVSRGLSYTIDLSKPKGQRITEVKFNNQPLELSRTYRAVVNSFIASGGDGHEVLKSANAFRLNTGVIDVDALTEIIKRLVKVNLKIEGRVKLINSPQKTSLDAHKPKAA